MKVKVSVPNGYTPKKIDKASSLLEDAISEDCARCYSGWIPKSYYKMTIPGMEHIQAKSRQKVAHVPTIAPISDKVPLLWVACTKGEVLGISKDTENSNKFSALVSSEARTMRIEHWGNQSKKETVELNHSSQVGTPLAFLQVGGVYLILDDQGRVHMFSFNGECIQVVSSTSNPIVSLAKVDSVYADSGVEKPLIAMGHLFGEVRFFTLKPDGFSSVHYTIATGLFFPHKMTIRDNYLLVAGKSSQYGLFSIVTRSSLLFNSTVAPIIDICIVSLDSTNHAFCLLTENARVIVIVPPINISVKDGASNTISFGELLRNTTYTLSFGRSEEFPPTSLAATYNDSLVTVFITTTGGHVQMRRLGIVHEIASANLTSFKLDSDTSSFIQVSKHNASRKPVDYYHLLYRAFSSDAGTGANANDTRSLEQEIAHAATEPFSYYAIDFNVLLYSSLPELSGCEEGLISVTILTVVKEGTLTFVTGIVTSMSGILIWFRVPLLYHNLTSQNESGLQNN